MINTQEGLQTASASWEGGKPVWIEPDLDFIQALSKQDKGNFKKCFQCGTCSVTCALSPDQKPFPRKEMIWATWGMKDRLFKDPDIWLCHHCNDCSTRCPRGARPGDILSAIRQQIILHYAFPRFLGRWVNQPKYIPLLLGIPAVLLGLLLLIREPLENILGISRLGSDKIVYSYSSVFPHWALNTFFFFFTAVVLLVVITGVVRFWRALKSSPAADGKTSPAKSLYPSIISALKGIIAHNSFTKCTTSYSRLLSHFIVFFGFISLTVVTIWVMTAKFNPLIPGSFVYPFNFWNPLKMLANLGGVAIVVGCLLMIIDRLKDSQHAGANSYFDWALIATLFCVVATGFITELLHYARLVPHRHVAYFIHLVFVFALLMYLPYSKFAHMIYRTVAMAYAELTGRDTNTAPTKSS